MASATFKRVRKFPGHGRAMAWDESVERVHFLEEHVRLSDFCRAWNVRWNSEQAGGPRKRTKKTESGKGREPSREQREKYIDWAAQRDVVYECLQEDRLCHPVLLRCFLRQQSNCPFSAPEQIPDIASYGRARAQKIARLQDWLDREYPHQNIPVPLPGSFFERLAFHQHRLNPVASWDMAKIAEELSRRLVRTRLVGDAGNDQVMASIDALVQARRLLWKPGKLATLEAMKELEAMPPANGKARDDAVYKAQFQKEIGSLRAEYESGLKTTAEPGVAPDTPEYAALARDTVPQPTLRDIVVTPLGMRTRVAVNWRKEFGIPPVHRAAPKAANTAGWSARQVGEDLRSAITQRARRLGPWAKIQGKDHRIVEHFVELVAELDLLTELNVPQNLLARSVFFKALDRLHKIRRVPGKCPLPDSYRTGRQDLISSLAQDYGECRYFRS